eukprot:SAG31_NODE_2930_length_4898_cov_3.710356_5_plen_85_part_00
MSGRAIRCQLGRRRRNRQQRSFGALSSLKARADLGRDHGTRYNIGEAESLGLAYKLVHLEVFDRIAVYACVGLAGYNGAENMNK